MIKELKRDFLGMLKNGKSLVEIKNSLRNWEVVRLTDRELRVKKSVGLGQVWASIRPVSNLVNVKYFDF